MELLLIRHAKPFRATPTEGPADPSLDPVGVRQAARLSEWLAREQITAIYTSPLARARETAAPLAARFGLDPIIEEGVAEWDRDAPAYIPIEELQATGHPWWQAMAAGDWELLGVDPEAFGQRVVAAIDAIAGRHPSERVAIVCHGGVINLYVAEVVGLGRRLFFQPTYTSISRVLVSRAGVRSLETLNERAHLRDLA